MTLLTLSNGKELEVIRVIKGTVFHVLHIYLNSITAGEAWDIFNDPDSLKTITVIGQIIRQTDGETPVTEEQTKVYRNYSRLHSISKSALDDDPSVIMVWLDIDYDDE